MAVRTIACLPAIIGSWRHPGGGAMLSTSGTYDFAMDKLIRPDLSPPGTRTVNMNQLGEALAGELPGPPVRALYVYNCNPAAVAPNQAKVLEGLRREDLFVVVHELFATDTVDYADIVLPATSQLEHVDIHGSYGHLDVMYNPPAIAPRGECRSNNDVFRAWPQRLGFEPELFPDDDTLIRQVLDGGPTLEGITLERLKERGLDPAQHPGDVRSVCRWRVSDAVGQVRAVFRGHEGRRLGPAADIHPAARRSANASRPGGAASAPAPQPAAAAVLEFDVRQFAAPSHRRRRSHDRAVRPRMLGLEA